MNNNLRGFLNAQDAIDAILLYFKNPASNFIVYILVEGLNDCRIYKKFFNTKIADIEFVGGGKGQVIKALLELNKHTRQILGICDADFRHLENNYHDNMPNLFFTDCHDIEMTMLRIDGLLRNVLFVYNEQDNAKVILDKALEEAKFPAYTRWYNEAYNIKLDFQKVNLGGVTAPHNINISLNTENYLYNLNIRSSNKTKEVNRGEIDEFSKSKRVVDIYNLCNGHDVTLIISLILGGKVNKEAFRDNLQISFCLPHFKTTKLYADILQWQTNNNYQILLDAHCRVCYRPE